MSTIHPAQRLILSAIAVTLSTSAVAYADMPTTSVSPLDLQKLLLYRVNTSHSEVRTKDSSATLISKDSPNSHSEVDYDP